MRLDSPDMEVYVSIEVWQGFGALMHGVQNRSSPPHPSLAFVMIIRTSILPAFSLHCASLTRSLAKESSFAHPLERALDDVGVVINILVIIALFNSTSSPHARARARRLGIPSHKWSFAFGLLACEPSLSRNNSRGWVPSTYHKLNYIHGAYGR